MAKFFQINGKLLNIGLITKLGNIENYFSRYKFDILYSGGEKITIYSKAELENKEGFEKLFKMWKEIRDAMEITTFQNDFLEIE